MPISELQASIQRENRSVDKKYKTANTVRTVSNVAAGSIVAGLGYLGTKSISKEKSMLKDGLAGASDFVLKHLNNGIKRIDKKEKLKGVTKLLQKAKDAPAKTKALAVFGAFIATRFLKLIKTNSYIKGALNQAKADEKAVRANRAFEDEAIEIAKRKELLEDINPAEILEETARMEFKEIEEE